MVVDIHTQRKPNGVEVAQFPSSEVKFRRVFDAYLQTVQRFCVRRLSPADANDAVSEVFLVAWRRLDDIPDGDEARPWLLGVARNVVRNIERSGRRSLRLVAKASDASETMELAPEALIVRHSEYDEIDSALQSLSRSDREVIRLRAWEELTAPEIAAVLDISVSAAEKRMVRAMSRLAVALSKATSESARTVEGGDA